jgi:hypothetical protein
MALENNSMNLSTARIKVSLLSRGVDFDEELFKNYKVNYYENQFVYDKTSEKITETSRIPQVIKLGDCVISAILLRKGSPWTLKVVGKKLHLYYKNVFVREVGLPERPAYFGKILSDGTLSERVIAVAGEATPGFFLYPDCFYFSEGKPCSFCSLKRTRNTVGKENIKDFTVQRIAEATKLFQTTKWKDIPIISITTGTLASDDDVEYIANMVRTVHDALDPKIRIHLLPSPPLNFKLMKKYKEAGVTSIAFNLEVFDRKIFKEICPGKNDFYGYDKFRQALEYAVGIFGEYNVFCGFVWGLEPVESVLEGYEYMLQRGISVSSNVFHADEGSVFAKRPQPTEGFIENLCEKQSELYQKYPKARTIFDVSMRSTLDFEIKRGDFE